jgi:hypothetical protein
MRAPLIAIVLSCASAAACAQPANDRGTSIEACFQLARAAAATCYDPRIGSVESLDCQKKRATTDECLAHAAQSAPSKAPTGIGSSKMPSETIPPELPPSAVSPNESAGIGSPSPPYGAVPSKKPSATGLPDNPTRTILPELPALAGPIGTRSANESMTGLESCFKAARIADAICSKLPDDPALRRDCFQKTNSAQLECLEHVLSEAPAGPATPKTPSEAARSEFSPSAALPGGSSERISPPRQAGTLETPAEVTSAEKSGSPPKAIVGTNPGEPPSSTEAPTGAIRPGIHPKTADVLARPTGTSWLISETTSPIDYSPLVTALMHSTSRVKAAPSALVVRCVGERTELLVRTDGTWTATRGHELRVDYQVNDQPAVGLQWILSSDGKTATYKDDPVSFLQSLPDAARLKINVADRASSSHDATFQTDGWDVVRNKVATACKWARTTDKTSSGGR